MVEGRHVKFIWLSAAFLGVLLLAAVFSGWLRYGTDLFLTMAANGISQCF